MKENSTSTQVKLKKKCTAYLCHLLDFSWNIISIGLVVMTICHSGKYLSLHGRLLTQVDQLISSQWLMRKWNVWTNTAPGLKMGSCTPVHSTNTMAVGQPRCSTLQASTQVQHWGVSQIPSVTQGNVLAPFLSFGWPLLAVFDISFQMSRVFMDTMLSNNEDCQGKNPSGSMHWQQKDPY